jgi:hypothetical protein
VNPASDSATGYALAAGERDQSPAGTGQADTLAAHD